MIALEDKALLYQHQGIVFLGVSRTPSRDVFSLFEYPPKSQSYEYCKGLLFLFFLVVAFKESNI